MGEESKSDKYKWVGTIATAVVSIVVAVTSMWETKINASSQEAVSRESYVALSGAVESMSEQIQEQHVQLVSLKAYIDARKELRSSRAADGPPPPPPERPGTAGAAPPRRAASARRATPSAEGAEEALDEEGAEEVEEMPPPPPLPKPKGVKLPSYDAMQQKAN